MTAKQRRILLAALLGLTGAAVIWVGNEDEPETAAVQPLPGRARNAPASAAAAPLAEGLRLSRFGDEVADIFAAAHPANLPPPEEEEAEPEPARPPPLPFAYLGKLAQDGKFTVFLTAGQRNLVVRVGDVIDGTYRVESIQPPLMTLIYLPLGETQILNIGVAN